jgi:AAA domain
MNSAEPLASMMGPVARKLFGDPNECMSKADTLRFGTNGSIEVNTVEGWFNDYEGGAKGGVLALIAHKAGTRTEAEAFKWLEHQGIKDAAGPRPAKPASIFYDYRDENDVTVFRVERRPAGASSRFIQHGPAPGGGFYSAKGCMQGVRRVLYRLPDIMAADPAAIVFVCEGEKDADRVAAAGLVSTTNPGGAGKFLADHAEVLRGRTVAVLEDNDEAGRKHVADVAAKLAGIAERCAILRLPDLPPKGDVSDWLDRGSTPAQLFDHAAAALAGDLSDPLPMIEVDCQGTALLPFEWAGDVKPVLEDFWLVDGLLPRDGPATLIGKPGAAKTFLAASLAAHVADGKDWAGRKVFGGLVVYVAAEGQRGFRNRLVALRNEGQLSPAAPFAFVPATIDMQSPKGDVARLNATIRELTARAGKSPALIVLDTLSKTFGAGQENTDDMAAYVANCERVSQEFGCLVLILHHPGKSGDARGERGHSSLRGGVVTAIHIEARDDGLRTATVMKQKDGEEGTTIPFRLLPVTVGTDPSDRDVTTCIVEFLDASDAGVSFDASRNVQRLTGQKRIAFDLINAELVRAGQYPPADIPGDILDPLKVTRVIGAGQVADKLKSEFLATASGAPDKQADTAARTARRAISDLKAAHILATWEDWLWLV